MILRRFLSVVSIGLLLDAPMEARANFAISPTGASTLFAVDSSNATAVGSAGCATVECAAHVMIDATGHLFGVSGNPLTVTGAGGSFPITGTVTANLGTLNGAATQTTLASLLTALGTPFQAGASIGNTSFGISGTLPAFASTPAFTMSGALPADAGGTSLTTLNTTLTTLNTSVQSSVPSGSNIIGGVTIAGTLPGFTGTPAFNISQIGGASWALGNSAPAASAPVILPDEADGCAISSSGTCTVSSAATLAIIDMTGYANATVTVTANAGGNTLSFTRSQDLVNYTPELMISNGAVNGGIISGINSTAVPYDYDTVFKPHYLKIAVTTYVSGSTTITVRLHQNSRPGLVGIPPLAAGTSAVGIVGPGYTSNQTVETVSANGTTGAQTATLAAGGPGKTTYLCGFLVSANATAGAIGSVTVTGIITGTWTINYFVAPSTAAPSILNPNFSNCLPASATNTGIAVAAPAAGTGGTESVQAWGYYQ